MGDLDALLGPTDGTILATDFTGNKTLSRTALQNVGSGVDISINSPDGITFNNLSSTLSLQTSINRNVSFDSGTGSLIFTDPTDILSASGASITLTAGSDLTVGNLNTNGGNVVLSAGNVAAGNLSFGGILTNGSGNLSLAATNVAGGSITQIGSTSAAGQAISITATNDVSVNSLRGTTVGLTSNTGSVLSQASSYVQASAQLSVSAATGINLNTLAVFLQATNTAGNINITQVASPAQTLTINGSGVVNSALNGTVTITNLGSGIALTSGSGGVQSNDGDITLAALDLQIDVAISAGTGRTTLANSTAGRQIDIGTNSAGKLGLTIGEIGLVTSTTGVLQIGSATAGAITISNAIGTVQSGKLTLVNNANITQGPSGILSVANLRVSSGGSVDLSGSNLVSTLAASTTGSFKFSNVNPLTIGVVDGVTGITTTNSDVTILADTLDVANAVSAGNGPTGGVVTFAPFTPGTDIDVGTETVGNLSLTDTELNRVTARVLRIGSATAGDVVVSDAITLGASVPALSLISGETITDTGAGSLTVDALRVSGGGDVFLNSANNDVNFLAGDAASGVATEDFYFVDMSGFQVATVDGVAGITTPTGASNTITLTAGGAVTQAAGAKITTNGLQLLGAGSFALNEVTNEATTIAANLTTSGTGTLSYTDATGLSIGTVTPGDGAPATSSVNTNNSNISIDTVNGPLSVTNANGSAAADVNAGTGTVILVAGSAAGVDNALTLNASAGVTGTGGVAFFADNMSVGAAVNAGTNTARLDTFDAATAINLGGADGAATLGLTSAEINQVTAGVIVVGDTLNTGDITNTAAIAATGTQQLELETGGAIFNGGGSITETRFGLTAGTGIGTSGAPIATTVSNIEATTNTGGVFVANVNSVLTIGGVNATLTGVDAAGGDISVTNNTGAGDASITVSEEVTNTGGGNITVAALNPTSVTGNVNVNAAITATGGNGNIRVEAEDNLGVTAAISAVGTGKITLIADPTIGPSANAGNFSNSPTGTVTTENGDILVQAGDSITLGGAFKAGGAGNATFFANAAVDGVGVFNSNSDGTITTEGGDVTIIGLDVNIGGAIDATTTVADDGEVFLLTSRPTDSVQLGTNVGFGITQTDIDNITAAVLNIGSAATNTAGIQTTSQIVLSSSKVPVLSLETAGAIVDSTGGEQTDITVQSLALRAENGIGSGLRGDPGDLDVAATNLAVANVNQGTAPTGDVNLFNTGSLTIARNIDGLSGVTNSAPLGNITIGTGSPLIIDAPILDDQGGSIDLFTTGTDGDITQTVNGNISATGGNGNILLDTSGATSGGLITINPNLTQPFDIGTVGTGDITLLARAGVLFQGVGGFGPNIVATNGDIFVTSNAGVPNGTEDIVLQASTTLATEGNITLDADPDNDCVGGAIIMSPNAALIGSDPTPGAAAQNIFLNAAGNITLATLTADSTISVDSCSAILDGNDPATGTLNITADTLVLSAKTGIGVTSSSPMISAADAPLEIQVNNLEAVTQTGGIFLVNTGTVLHIGGASASIDGVQATTSGDISITNDDSIVLDGTSDENIRATAGNVTVTANGMTSNVEIRNDASASIDSDSGNVTINAGQDILLGVSSFSGTGHVEANGNIVLTAGRDIIVEEGTTVTAFGTGTIMATAGQNISILQTLGVTGARIATEGGSITLSTGANGLLTVDSDSVGGTILTTLNGGNGDIIIGADHANITSGDTIQAGTGIVTLKQKSAAWAIDLGSMTDAATSTLELSNDELDRVFGSIIRVGDAANAGNITVTTAITPANVSQFELFTAGGIVDGNAGLDDITVSKLALTAGTGIGVSGSDTKLDVVVSNLEATTNTGGVFIRGDGSLTIGGVNATLNGVSAAGGFINISANGNGGTPGNLTVDEAVSNTGGGDITLATFDAINSTTLTVNASVIATGGNGKVTIAADGNVTVNSSVSASGTGSITVDADAEGNGVGEVQVTATGSIATAGGDVTITAQDIDIAGPINVGTAQNSDVFLLARGAATVINLGTDTGFGLTDSDLDRVTAGVLHVGAAANTGGINISGQITQAGGGGYGTLSLETGAAISESTATEQADITVTNLALRAGSGIGTSAVNGDLDIAVSKLAFNNTTTGDVVITNSGALAISSRAGFATSGNASTGNTVITATGAMTFTVNTTTGGNATYTVTDSAATGERVNVSAGVTVSSVGNVALQAGDSIIIDGTVATTGMAGVVTLAVDFGNADAPGGTLILSATSAINSANSANSAMILGNTNADAFNVRPQLKPTGARLTISGAAPTTSPGDTLNVDLTGVAGTSFGSGGVGSGIYSFTNHRSIIFSGIESFTPLPGTSATSATTVTSGTTVTIADSGRLPFRRLAVGAATGGTVAVFDNGSSSASFVFAPYAGFTGSVAVAVGDVNGDGVADIATGIASTGPSHVKVFSGATGGEIFSLIAFSGFNSGVSVALGDLDGDGRAEVIVSTASMVPHVKVFDGLSGALRSSFFAFGDGGPPPAIGVSLAAGDTDGDGRAEIFVGAKAGAPHVKTFDILGNVLRSFFAFAPGSFNSGVMVGAGDLDGDGRSEILAGATTANRNFVNVFGPDQVLRATLALPPANNTSISQFGPAVAASDTDGDGDEEIQVANGSTISTFDGRTFGMVNAFAPFPGYLGGIYVG